MSKLTAAYVAGFVDGEGYIGIIKDSRKITFRRTDHYEAVIKIANTNKEIIFWFKESFGGNIHLRKFLGNPKDAYCWTLAGEKIVPILDSIIPYLKIKKEQAMLVKKLRKTYCSESYEYINRTAKNGGHLTSKTTKENILDVREKYYKQIRELNHRGKLCTLRD